MSTQNSFKKARVRRFAPDWKTWYNDIVPYLKSIEDVRVIVCVRCGFAKVYDKNEKEYMVTKNMTLIRAKEIMEAVLKINSE